MNRREEIMSDRKLLNALLEKYGKEDVMQFLDANFDDDNETNYFDTFSKEDAAYKEMILPAQALIKE